MSLHTNDREEFLSRLRQRVRDSGVRRFDVRFNRVAWYPNFERNRWFLSLGAEKLENDELNGLLHASNEACHSMNQPELYVPQRSKDGERSGKVAKKAKGNIVGKVAVSAKAGKIADCSDSFHVSLAWSLMEKVIIKHDAGNLPKEVGSLSVPFDCVKVKIGNVVTSLDLKAS
jgi:hypothetical protein